MVEPKGNTPADELIARFNEDHQYSGDEELVSVRRLAANLVGSDLLSVDSLTNLFKRAHENIPTGATYLIAYKVIEEATKTGKFNNSTLGIVYQSIMKDEDPTLTSPELREWMNTLIWKNIIMNQRLFELMVPYMNR